MPFVNAKCTNCGADLEINNNRDVLVCQFCGATFVAEKAINNYNVTNNISADTVYVSDGNSSDFTIIAGKLIKYKGKSADVVIPNDVTVIGNSAFEGCSGLKSVIIPNSVIAIGENAFFNCSELTSITIPNSVKTVGKSAFSRCSALKSVTIPNSITTIGDFAFAVCMALSDVTLPNSITAIGNNVFLCSGLKSITIPNSVSVIGDSAFAGCSGLTCITIPNSINFIGRNTFSGCVNLQNVTILSDKIDYRNFGEDTPFFQNMQEKQEYIEKGLCQHCGGKFKVFSKKCRGCGIAKDY